MTKNETVPVFTKEMKETHTILIPEMLPIHFEMVKNIFHEYGYKAEILSNKGQQVVQIGLKYVHNDMCYPALLVIGQMIDALQSGNYDVDKVALVMSQTGGGCRASNYLNLIRKALKRAGMGHVPVISLNLSGLEDNPGIHITYPMLKKDIAALAYGDELMHLGNQIRPYETHLGETERMMGEWIEKICAMFRVGKGYSLLQMKSTMDVIAKDFSAIETIKRDKVKVGIVGEIFVKYSALGNNELEKFLHEQDCEVMVPGVMHFGMYCMSNVAEDRKLYGGKFWVSAGAKFLLFYFDKVEKYMLKAMKRYGHRPPADYFSTREKAIGVVSHGSKMGEGWLLTAEMVGLVEEGFPNIVCAQPFGCLPNHINGRGMMNKIKQVSPQANIVAIDYDTSASRVNQENRIKLMLASARPAAAPMQHSEGLIDNLSKVPGKVVKKAGEIAKGKRESAGALAQSSKGDA